jgi:hypothetical protein
MEVTPYSVKGAAGTPDFSTPDAGKIRSINSGKGK